MGAYFDTIPKSMIEWILAQKVFWVSTAPLSGTGHVNVSPKGGAYFGLLDEKTFWYMDLTGSGNETISHLYEPGNGRITVLFNAFEGPPRIVRLYGHGRVLEYGTEAFEDFAKKHDVELLPGTRSVIVVDVHQVGSSCGFSVPYFDFKEFRSTLNEYFEKKAKKFDQGNEKESMPRYWALKNAASVDGLPGLKTGVETMKKEGIVPSKKMDKSRPVPKYQQPVNGFTVEQMVLAILITAMLSVCLTTYGPQVLIAIRRSIATNAKKPFWPLPSISR